MWQWSDWLQAPETMCAGKGMVADSPLSMSSLYFPYCLPSLIPRCTGKADKGECNGKDAREPRHRQLEMVQVAGSPAGRVDDLNVGGSRSMSVDDGLKKFGLY